MPQVGTINHGWFMIACISEWQELANPLPGPISQLIALPYRQLVSAWPLILRLRHDSDPHRPETVKST